MATLDYELILMLDPEAGDEQRDKVASDAKAKLEAAGEVKHEGTWGTRKMAYEIDKRGEADYRVWRFTGGKDLLDDLDHSLKITDGVLRFRIFKVPADSPNTIPPDTEQIMRRDEEDRPRGRGRDGDRGGPRRSRSDAPTPPDAPTPDGDASSSSDTAPTSSDAPTPSADDGERSSEVAPPPPAGNGDGERSSEVAPASAAGTEDPGA